MQPNRATRGETVIAKCTAITREPRASFGRSLAVSLEGRVEASDQCRAVEGLDQEADCSGLQRLRAQALVVKGGDENERHAGSLGCQESLQLDAACPRHLDICNDTGRVIPMA